MSTQQAAVERVHPPRWLITHVANPVARRMLRKDGKIAEEILLLRFEGRKTGRRYEIPVGYKRIDGRLALFTSSGWRHNFHGGRQVELVLHGEAIGARATLLSDPRRVAAIYQRIIDEIGLEDATRRLGIKVHVHRRPTLPELTDMVRDSGLSVVWLDPVD